MVYKCAECGHLFEDGEEARWREALGWAWGQPYYEDMSGCPLCKGEYEETVPCSICGSRHTEGEDALFGGVCGECIDDYRKDFDTCYNISLEWDEKIEVPINPLISTLLDASDIEQILVEYIRQNCKDVDCSRFIDEDKWWFGERLAKEVRKNENCKKQS